MSGDNHYDVLSVTPSSTPPEVRKAYLALARRFHPDYHASDSDDVRAHAEEMMRSINEAWEHLGTADARMRYDKQLIARGAMTPDRSRVTATANTVHQTEADVATGSAPPRWLTMLPALFLAMGVVFFAIGMVTGIAVVLGGAIGAALLGGLLFAFVPMVALKRAAGPIRDSGEARARA